jgi:hypothetical protein
LFVTKKLSVSLCVFRAPLQLLLCFYSHFTHISALCFCPYFLIFLPPYFYSWVYFCFQFELPVGSAGDRYYRMRLKRFVVLLLAVLYSLLTAPHRF